MNMLTIKDLQDKMKLSRSSVLKLVNSDGFPCIKIGKQYRVPEDEFEKWVQKYSYSAFHM